TCVPDPLALTPQFPSLPWRSPAAVRACFVVRADRSSSPRGEKTQTSHALVLRGTDRSDPPANSSSDLAANTPWSRSPLILQSRFAQPAATDSPPQIDPAPLATSTGVALLRIAPALRTGTARHTSTSVMTS